MGSRGVSIREIDLSRCGPNSPLHELAKRARRKPREFRESAEQRALFEWARDPRTRAVWPELHRLYSVPNFSGCVKGATEIQSATLTAEGRERGVPDVVLPYGRGGYFGLYIEMKDPETGRVRPEQAKWLEALARAGYFVDVCWSAQEARQCITQYLAMAPTPLPPYHSPRISRRR